MSDYEKYHGTHASQLEGGRKDLIDMCGAAGKCLLDKLNDWMKVRLLCSSFHRIPCYYERE